MHVAVPVDHEFDGQSTYGNQQVLKARVIESPVDAIELGGADDRGLGERRRSRDQSGSRKRGERRRQ